MTAAALPSRALPLRARAAPQLFVFTALNATSSLRCFDPATGTYDTAACAKYTTTAPSGANLASNTVPVGKLAAYYSLPTSSLPGICLVRVRAPPRGCRRRRR